MKLLLLCPLWGNEKIPLEEFISNVKDAGYDGIETWMLSDEREQQKLLRLIAEYKLCLIAHQHEATGKNIKEFCNSFEYYLNKCLEANPLLINSHSGKDSFTLDEQLKVIDVAEEFAAKNNVVILHETHRGRIGYHPAALREIFALRRQMNITGDFSHWVCVTESYLEDFTDELNIAIQRTKHLHARVGFPEGPQIPDPRFIIWKEPVDFFLNLWDKIIDYQKTSGAQHFTITTEFGPPPYMWVEPSTGKPLSSQWDINVYMKDLLRQRYRLT